MSFFYRMMAIWGKIFFKTLFVSVVPIQQKMEHQHSGCMLILARAVCSKYADCLKYVSWFGDLVHGWLVYMLRIHFARYAFISFLCSRAVKGTQSQTYINTHFQICFFSLCHLYLPTRQREGKSRGGDFLKNEREKGVERRNFGLEWSVHDPFGHC